MSPPDADHFQRLEEQLLHPDVRRSAVTLGRLLADDFIEIGRSGRVYTRDDLITALAAEGPLGHVTMENFQVRALSAEAVLTTYVSYRAGEVGATAAPTLRSSIWVLRGEFWQMTFHQGTPTHNSSGAGSKDGCFK